ncbi:hypothetical protein [Levilactobacillus yonginensis]|uniref:hypothetical protein n=1 Tax=Levilactobacillus yonginensis TaxID=1054041 RepID=UPI00345D4662
MMGGSLLTGTLIFISGLALLIFIVAKLVPKTGRDTDTVVLLSIFALIAVGLLGMGGWLGMANWGAMGCFL